MMYGQKKIKIYYINVCSPSADRDNILNNADFTSGV